MNAACFVLARVLLQDGGLPLPHRAAWALWLSDIEPHPADVHSAAQTLRASGLMAHDSLTPEGVLAALEALHGVLAQ